MSVEKRTFLIIFKNKNMDLKTFTSAIAQIAEEKGISKEKVIEVIEMAIAAAYKKDYGMKGQIIKAKLDDETGEVKFSQVKIVVDESMILSDEELEELKKQKEEKGEVFSEGFQEIIPEEGEKKIRFNPEKHIILEEAKKIRKDIQSGEELEFTLEAQADYGRIAAMTAKQVIIQRIREAERESVFDEYKSKEGEVISGMVQRIEGKNVFFDIGKTIGLLPPVEQIPGEFYRIGARLRLFVLKVDKDAKGPVILLSRAYPKFLSKLFEIEVPEVASKAVVIKSIAREPGSRSKIAVKSEQEGIDPIGSMVGQKGTRVSVVIEELGGEKIDIIEWSEDPEKFVAASLSPAKVLEVRVTKNKNQAVAVVPEEQLSLAIGRDGQNVRLAAKLTGWKIDVRPPDAIKEEEENEEPDTKENEENLEEKSEAVSEENTQAAEEKKTKKKSAKKATIKKETKKSKTENKKEEEETAA